MESTITETSESFEIWLSKDFVADDLRDTLGNYPYDTYYKKD
jgi:hypothetical protein